MFLDINQMQAGGVRFNETFPPGAIEFLDQQLCQATPLESTGSAELVEALMEIRVRGRLKTEMEYACDRCLEPARFPIDADFDLLYRPASCSPAREEVQIEGAEAEVGFYEDGGLELGDVLREQILLLLPMQRVCRGDCKGICPICGQNRNMDDCGCHEVARDDRWVDLKNL